MTENEENAHHIVKTKSAEEFKSSNKISIEDIDFFSKKVKITSPRSIKAMNNLGINNQDLEFLTFKEYLEKNPRLIAESKRIQKIEYNHIQAIRKELINQVIEARKLIISEGNQNKKRTVSSRFRKSLAIENNINLYHSNDLTEKDLKAINRMKNINKTTLSNRLELELKKELKSLINNEMEQKANEKKLMFSQKVERKRKLENLKKMTDEEEKERMAKVLDKQQRKDEEKRIQDLIDEELAEIKLKKLKQKEEIKHKKNNALKREEYKKKLTQLRDLEHKAVVEKSEKKQRKVRDNIIRLMANKRKKRLNSEINFKNKMKIVEDNKKKLEEEFELNNQILLYRQKVQQQRKERDEEKKNKELKLYQKRIISQGKNNDIELLFNRKNLDENQMMEFLNNMEFFNERERKQKETLIKNEILLNKRKENIMNKIKERGRNIERTQYEKDYNYLIDKEKKLIKKLDQRNKVRLMEQYLINKRENLRKEQYKRDKKINRFMRNKTGILHKKKLIYDEMMKENEQENDRIEKILYRKSYDTKSLNSFKDIFPENEKIDEIINEINVHNEKKKNSRYRINSAY